MVLIEKHVPFSLLIILKKNCFFEGKGKVFISLNVFRLGKQTFFFQIFRSVHSYGFIRNSGQALMVYVILN